MTDDDIKALIKWLEGSETTRPIPLWDEIEAILSAFRTLLAEREQAERRGFLEGWQKAHEPAKCGHARANWKDPAFNTPEYAGNERCEVCAERERDRGEIGRLYRVAAAAHALVTRHDFWSRDFPTPGEFDDLEESLAALIPTAPEPEDDE